MKSKIYLILFAIFAFSCSSDSSSDDGNNNNNGGNNNTGNALLVSEIIYSNDDNIDGTQYTDRYFYDGNKLTSIVEEYSDQGGNSGIDYLYNFIYTNNKISRVDEYYGDTSTGIEGRYTFEYDNQGRISSYDYCYFAGNGTCDYNDTTNLTYSSNGTVTVSTVYNDDSTNEETYQYTLQLDNNGNIISGYDSESNVSLDYDNQNSPFKNIVGMDAIMLLEFGTEDLQFNAYNNCTSFNAIFTSNNEGDQYNYAYDYNEDGYPRQVIATYQGGNFEGNTVTTTIEINYY